MKYMERRRTFRCLTRSSLRCSSTPCRGTNGNAPWRAVVGFSLRAQRVDAWVSSAAGHCAVKRLQSQPDSDSTSRSDDFEPQTGGRPGNVLLLAKNTGLRKDSVVNVSQLITVNKSFLTEQIGRLTDKQQQAVDDGLRLVLAL